MKIIKLTLIILSIGATALLFNRPAIAGYTLCRNSPKANFPHCFKRGDRGILIRKISDELRNTGYYKGKSFDRFDLNLQTSVIRFQRDYRLQASDGIIGYETLVHICKVSARGCRPTDEASCYQGSVRGITNCLLDFQTGLGED